MSETSQQAAKRRQAVPHTYVTGREAAKIKGVSQKSIYTAIEKGIIKVACRKGGCFLIDVKDLEKYQPIGHRPGKQRRRSRKPVEAQSDQPETTE